jgi:hypothetical protein
MKIYYCGKTVIAASGLPDWARWNSANEIQLEGNSLGDRPLCYSIFQGNLYLADSVASLQQ